MAVGGWAVTFGTARRRMAGGLRPRNFVKMFDADKTRMIGLPYYDVKQFSSNPGTSRSMDRQTDGRTDGQTDRFAVSISRVSVLTADAR